MVRPLLLSRHRRAETVRGHQQAELMRPNAQRRHQNRPERHHDHEIENMAELNASQRQQEKTFGTGRKLGGHRGGRNKRVRQGYAAWAAVSHKRSASET